MKYCLVLLLILIGSFNLFAQDTSNSLKIKSISAGFGVCAGENNDGGFCLGIDFTTYYKKNLFSVSGSTGSEFEIFDAIREYREIGLLYGRQIITTKVFKTEVHIGASIFNETIKTGETNFKEVNSNVIAFPIKIKFLFYTSKNFALGLNPNALLNSKNIIITGNLLFQYNFKTF